jgi:putative aldouronate transport system substrate-binding protein
MNQHEKRGMHKKIFPATGLLVSLTTLLAGCSSTAPSGGAAATPTTQAVDNTPTEISLLLKYFSAQPPNAEEAFKILEQHTNTKLKINWAPNPSYDEKVNTTLASGSLPNVMLVTKNKADNIVDAVNAGAFWELGPYLKDYPNLSKTISKDALYNVSYNGKVFSLPSLRGNNESTVLIRKDWLDNIGLKTPTTIDEFYETIKAFKNNDPDKNGKNDTLGLIETSDATTFHMVKIWMGASKMWGVQNGQLEPDFTTKEYLNAMNFMKKLYQEKLINEDFAVVTQNQMLDYINKEKGGFLSGSFPMLTNGYFNPLAETNPKAKLDLFDRVKGPSGDFRFPAGAGFNGVFMIPKSSVKTEAELKKILAFFDKLADDKMRTLISLGIEGKHYKMENNKPVLLDGKAFTNDVVPLRWIMVADGITDRVLAGLSPSDAQIAKVISDKELKMINDPTIPFTSKTIVDIKIIEDARSKYIMGQLDEKGWNDAIAKWRSNNGDKLIKEYNEQYAKVSK